MFGFTIFSVRATEVHCVSVRVLISMCRDGCGEMPGHGV